MKTLDHRLAVLALLACGASFLGCGSVITPLDPVLPVKPGPVTGSYSGSAFSGRVLAGERPVQGAAVQIYAAGTTGNGVAAGFLLGSTLTTDATGAFTVPSSYVCPLSTSQLYLVAQGGSVGSAAAPANAALALLSALGSCNGIAPATRFIVNEVTTVAAAWALAQFAGPSFGIGASPTNPIGLANAFKIAGNLASPLSGSATGTLSSGNVTLPTRRINTLANLLNTCTAATTSNTGNNPCGPLLAAASVTGSAAPLNTWDASLAVVRNPAANVAALYTLSLAGTAFAPALAATPPDWTLFLTISGGGMNGPATLGVLSSGNVWVSNYFGVASSFNPLGGPVFVSGITGSGLDHSYGLAVDASDNAWIGNEDKSTVTELTSSGVALSGASGFVGGGIDFPLAVAIDPDQSVWVADYGSAHISRLSPSGTSLAGTSGYSTSQIAFPAALAIDTNHTAWIANSEGTTVTRLSQDGTAVSSPACCDGPDGVAIDQRGNVWVSNFYGNSVSELSNNLSVLSTGYQAAALSRPQGIAVDGKGNVWVASFRGPGIVELAGSQTANPGGVLSPPAGWSPDASLLEPYSLAIDASGNVWIANFGNSTLTQIVGLASPVKTPAIGPAQAP